MEPIEEDAGVGGRVGVDVFGEKFISLSGFEPRNFQPVA
jgi:hypothetical protein